MPVINLSPFSLMHTWPVSVIKKLPSRLLYLEACKLFSLLQIHMWLTIDKLFLQAPTFERATLESDDEDEEREPVRKKKRLAIVDDDDDEEGEWITWSQINRLASSRRRFQRLQKRKRGWAMITVRYSALFCSPVKGLFRLEIEIASNLWQAYN